MRNAWIRWTLLAYLLLALLLWGGKALYDASLKQRAWDRHEQRLQTAQTMIHDHLLSAVQAAHQLSLSEAVRRFIETPDAASRRRLERALIDTSNVYGRYDQLRLLDLAGRERVRINYGDAGGVAVPEAALQDKGARYYVREGRRLAVGEVYLSPLDLNVEAGEVVRPLKPTLRLVRMVGDGQGRPAALLVLNYKAGELLNQFRAHFPAGDRAMLINADGYWLLNHQRANEWGWQLGHPERTLAQWRPALWEQVQAAPAGRSTREGDLFSYLRFDIAELYHGALRGGYVVDLGMISDIRASEWTMLVETDRAIWQARALYREPWFRAFLVALFALVAALVFFVLQARQQRRAALAAERRQLADFKDLYENAPTGYVTLAASGLITNVNRALLDYLGYRREELVDRCHFAELVDDASHQGIEGLMASLSAGQWEQARVQMRCKNGDTLTVLCSVSSRVSETSTLMVGRCSVQDISRQVALERALERLAYHDPLTGLANRRYFDDLAAREIRRLRREGGPLTALAIDIDHFKAVNDRYGHDAGDQVLKALADTCQGLLRGTDILARFGGEEFTLLLPGATLEQGRRKAEAIRVALADAPVVLASGDTLGYTVSLGVATLEHPDEEGLRALLQRADAALYRAKRGGRNRVCTADDASLSTS